MDKLYFLKQFTRGEANAIVKSVMYGDDATHCQASAGKKIFDDKQRTLESIVAKAVEWPDMRPEDM